MVQWLLLSILIGAAGSLTACSKSLDKAPEKPVSFSVKLEPAAFVENSGAPVELTAATETQLSSGFAQSMLSAVNKARAQARQCGGRSMPAVAKLTWNKQLQRAAYIHSSDMAKYEFFSHTGLQGKEVSHRVQEQGYRWRAVGENISAGAVDVQAVMAGWLASPGHCANIMSADFTEMAAAVVTNKATYYEHYWTQVFAAPF